MVAIIFNAWTILDSAFPWTSSPSAANPTWFLSKAAESSSGSLLLLIHPSMAFWKPLGGGETWAEIWAVEAVEPIAKSLFSEGTGGGGTGMASERELWVLGRAGRMCGGCGRCLVVTLWSESPAELSVCSSPSACASVVPGLGPPAAPGMSRTILLSPSSVVGMEFGAWGYPGSLL